MAPTTKKHAHSPSKRKAAARKVTNQPSILDGAWRLVRPLFVYGCAFVMLLGLLFTGWRGVQERFLSPVDAGDHEAQIVTIQSGSSLSSVSRMLESEDLIRSGTVFKYYADLMGMGQRIQSGRYELTRSMSMTEILNTLVSGSGLPRTMQITVIPGWTAQNIADYLQRIGLFTSSQRFMELCREGTAFTDVYYIQEMLASGERGEDVQVALEGYLSPNTYEVYTDSTEEAIIFKLLRQTETAYLSAYEDRSAELGLTMAEVFTLASIVEKEAKTEDFARVSAVFHNRLQKKMTLDSDATVKYISGSSKMALNAEDISVSTPYNTYRNRGLPPGPICNPSMDAVMAALYPDEAFQREGYLYFCSTDPASGALHFSKTLEEHENAVAMYRPLWEEYDRQRNAQ